MFHNGSRSENKKQKREAHFQKCVHDRRTMRKKAQTEKQGLLPASCRRQALAAAGTVCCGILSYYNHIHFRKTVRGASPLRLTAFFRCGAAAAAPLWPHGRCTALRRASRQKAAGKPSACPVRLASGHSGSGARLPSRKMAGLPALQGRPYGSFYGASDARYSPGVMPVAFLKACEKYCGVS